MNNSSSLTIFTDGASKGNPGEASIGAALYVNNQEVANISKTIGISTNNVAEYTALIEALRKAIDLGFKEVLVNADSELMIKQLNGEYKVKNDGIKPLFAECQKLRRDFTSIKFKHVPRELNKRADQLANQALKNW